MRTNAPLAVVLVGIALSGCASQDKLSGAEHDPWESMNRGIHAFNDTLDRATLKPVAKGYKKVVPGFMRTGVTNFSQNLFAPASSLNNFLQGKGKRGFSELGRFLINTTIGLGGLFDVATDAGIERQHEDFRQTFAVWGMPDGPYVVVPFMGPRTLGDTVAIPFNIVSDPWYWHGNSSTRDKVYLLRAIDVRYRLLPAEELFKDSKDRYISIRETYLQNRRFKIYDGDPPVDDDFYEEFEEDSLDENEEDGDAGTSN